MQMIKMAQEIYYEKVVPNKSKVLWGLLVLFFIGIVSGLTIFSVHRTYAADETCYWVGDTNPAVWNDANHWSSLSGGNPAVNPCAGTSAKPDSGTAVIFDGGNTNSVTIDTAVSVDSLDLQAAYTGTFDNATNDQSITVANNVTMDSTRVDMGDATWTVSGSFDNYHVTTFNRNASTLIMNGATKEIISNYKQLNNITISGTISVPATSSVVEANGISNISGTLTIANTKTYAVSTSSGNLKVSGSIAGDGTLIISDSASISEKTGTITSIMGIRNNHSAATGSILPAIYEASAVTINCSTVANATLALSSGTYVFNNSVTFTNSNTGQLTVDNSANNPNLTFKGGVTVSIGAAAGITWTKGTGTITFSGTGAQSVNFLDKTVEDIRDSNTANTVTLTDGVITDGLTVDASATFNLAGQSFNYSAATGTTNNGTIKLQGNETIGANVSNLDVDSGTVTYIGDGTANPYNIVDFGATDYFNLTYTDANGTKITLRVGANALTVAGALTLSSGSGTFENSTNDQAVNVTGNVTMANTQVDMGDATWTVSGSFDNAGVTTFNSNLSTLVMDGDGKEITSTATKSLYKLTISLDASITVATASGEVRPNNTILVEGTFTIPMGESLSPSNGGDVKITSTGIITGAGTLDFTYRSKLTQLDGTLNVDNLKIRSDHTASYPILPAVYESDTVTIYCGAPADYSWVPSVGTYTFNGNVTFKGDDDYAKTYTINNSTNNPNFVFKGNVTFTNGTLGTLTWTKGNGTITFAGTGAQSVNFLDKTVEDIRDSNTANTVTLTDGVITDGLTVDANATFDIAGQDLQYVGAASTTNNGTIKLQGIETLTNVSDLGTNAGTVIYNGRNVAETLTLKNFAYNNLTITDANATKATFQPTNGSTLTVNGAFTLSSGTGTFDNATNDEPITVTGNVTMDSTRVDMGDATWTVSGSFDNASVGTFNYNASTLVMDGDGKEITSGGDAKKVKNFTVANDASISIASGSSSVYSAGKTQIDGTLTIPNGKAYSIYQSVPQLAVSGTGSIIGDGSLYLNESTQITEKAGAISVAKMYIYNNTGNGYIIPATYETADFRIIKNWASAETFKFGSGDYIFNGNVTFDNANATGALTIDNASNNPNISVKGNITVSESAGSMIYTKGTGTITFSGTGAQSVNFLDKTVETIRNSNTANTVTLTDGVNTNGITNDTGAKLDLASQAVSLAAAGAPSNDGTIYMRGNEVLTNFNDMDTNSGWVEYNGGAAYASLPNYSYNNINFNGAGSWSLGADLGVAGNFVNSAGTFTPNGKTVTLNGTNQTISGDTTFYNLIKNVTSAATLTFTAGSTQTVTNNLNLKGVAGQLLSLRSSVDGTYWNVVQGGVAGTYDFNYLDIKDSNHTGGADFIVFNSTDSGHNVGWAFPDHYELSTSDTPINAGKAGALTATLKDASGGTITYTGNTTMTFTGPTSSPDGWVPTINSTQIGTASTVAFTNGVSNLPFTFYKSETASVSATDTTGTSTTSPLAITVSKPTGTISITNQDNIGYLTNPNVTLALTLTGVETPSSSFVKLANDEISLGSASYNTYSDAPTYTLPSTDGRHRVYAMFKDAFGNTSTIAQSNESAPLDLTGPSNPSTVVMRDATDHPQETSEEITYGVLISWNASSDALSGIKGYVVSRGSTDLNTNNGVTDKVQTVSNSNSQELTQGSQYYVDLDSLEPSTSYTYSVKAIDNAGNTSSSTGATLQLSTNNKESGQSDGQDTITLSTTAPITEAEGKLTNIKDIKVVPSSTVGETTSATISWVNNVPATCLVMYGQDTSYPSKSKLDTSKKAYNSKCKVVVSDLLPETTYHFKVQSGDKDGTTVSSSDQTFTTKSKSESESVLEMIARRLSEFFSTIWHAIKSFFTGGKAQAADASSITGIHIVDVSSPDDSFLANTIYWPSTMGAVTVSRDGTELTQTDANFFLDATIEKDKDYTYAVNSLSGTSKEKESLPGGTPKITDLKAKASDVTQESANIIVTWNTIGVPATSKVTVEGCSGNAGKEDTSLDEMHTVVITGTNPESTCKITASSTSNDKQSSSGSLTYTVPEAEKSRSIFEIIIRALQNAFKSFARWIQT